MKHWVPAWSGSGEDPPPGCRGISHHLTWEKGEFCGILLFWKKVKHFIFLSLSSERQRERMHANTRPCTSRWGAEWEAETRRGKENPKQPPHCKRRALWEAGAHESVSKVTTWAQTKSQTLSHPGAPLWDPFYKGTNPIHKGWPFKT